MKYHGLFKLVYLMVTMDFLRIRTMFDRFQKQIFTLNYNTHMPHYTISNEENK